MRQFSILTAFLTLVIVGLAIALVISRLEVKQLRNEVKNSVSGDSFDRAILDQELGIRFILRLLDAPVENREALQFIGSIDGHIWFSRQTLPLYDDLEVYMFREAHRTISGRVFSDYEPKSICFLVDVSDENIVDVLFVDGELYGVVWANLRDTDFEQYLEHTDGVGIETQYAVNRDGFHRIDDETLRQQDIVHLEAKLTILESLPERASEIEELRKTLNDLKSEDLKKKPSRRHF